MVTPASLIVDNDPEWLEAQIVGAGYFDVLGVKPILGRTFRPDEDAQPGGNSVLVISERLWRQRFAGDPAVIGRTVDLNRHPFTIVGVVPAAFLGTMPGSAFDVWAPLSMIWEVRNQGRFFLTARGARGWHTLVRLRPGVGPAQAQSAVDAGTAQLASAYPDTNREVRHRVLPLARSPWGAQAVLGSALANLLLARAVSRQKEVAVRLAAGASRGQLFRQFLLESALLAGLGGAAGVAIARWAVPALPLVFLPRALVSQVHLNLQLDATTLAATALLTLASSLVFGFVPMVQAARVNLFDVLKESGRSAQGGAAHHRLRSALVVAEVALAVALLVSAGLCVQGHRQARRINFGFDPNHVLLAGLQIGMNGYTPETGKGFYRQLRERLAETPGIEEAALASWFPLGLRGCKGWDAEVEGYQRPPGEGTTCEFAIISPRYLATLRIPLLAGRDFTDADDAHAAPVALVNEHFARRFWPGRDPIGLRFRCGGAWRTVVGVVKAGKYNRLDEGPWPFFYLPYQQGVPDLDLGICVRVKGDPAAFASTVRQVVRGLDPGVDLLRPLPLADHSQLVMFAQRMTSGLLLSLGLISLLLAALGVYAVMAYAVSQRTQEFGIRLALGAQIGDVLRQVVGSGLRLAGLGVVIGLALAAGLSRLLSGFLWGVNPFDPVTFVAVPGILMLVALSACYLPARWAARVDPMVALRSE
jgi:predicted permease